MNRKLVVAPLVAGVTLFLTAAPVFAQDCFVANRSSTGSQKAGTHSPQWFALTIAGDFLSLPAGQCATDVNRALTAAGLPTVVATRTDKVLLANLPAARSGLLANGKGIDHFDAPNDALVNKVQNVVGPVLATDPACA